MLKIGTAPTKATKEENKNEILVYLMTLPMIEYKQV
jgi:hypothetical protein